MEKLNLIPNESLGPFVIGKNIKEYDYLPNYKINHTHKYYDYDSYEFDDYGVSLKVDKNNDVEIICCEKQCYWKGENLIKMPIDTFLTEYNLTPNEVDSIYVLISENRGQNQTVYDFDELGLIVWTWRGKIRSISIYKYDPEDENRY